MTGVFKSDAVTVVFNNESFRIYVGHHELSNIKSYEVRDDILYLSFEGDEIKIEEMKRTVVRFSNVRVV